MNTGTKVALGVIAGAAVVAAAAYLIDVDVSGDLELPAVEARVEGGEMPAVDVNTADIDVQERQANVPYPSDVDVDVETNEASIPYPSIDVTKPEEDVRAEEDDLNLNNES